MAPAVWHPNLRFEDERNNNSSEENDSGSINEMTFWYFVFLVGTLVLWLLIYFVLRIISIRQKTRDPQRNQMYGGARARDSLGQSAPTIYVSPSNLPPPPKYEFMAPPSYEEVVGVHGGAYPRVSTSTVAVQPIAQPIADAMSNPSTSLPTNRTSNPTPEVIVDSSSSTTITLETPKATVNVASS